MIGPDSRPRLARQARLRVDDARGERLLLYPERALRLNATAAAIVELCRGELDVAAMAARLREACGGREAIEEDVLAFLRALEERGLLVDAARPEPRP